MLRNSCPQVVFAFWLFAAGCSGPAAGLTRYTGTILSIDEPAGSAVFPQTGHSEPYTLVDVALNRVRDSGGNSSQPPYPIRVQIVAIGLRRPLELGSRGDTISFDSASALTDGASCELTTLRNLSITPR